MDLNYRGIRLLALLGLAKEVKIMRPKAASNRTALEPTTICLVVQHNADQ